MPPRLLPAIAGFTCLAHTLSCAAGEISVPHKGEWYVQAGIGVVDFNADAALAAGGIPLVGSNVKLRDNVTAAAGLGYFVTPNISVMGIVGLPPRARMIGKGGLVDGADLGEVTYGPAALVLNYHFTGYGAFQPFVGAGADYTVILDQKDGLLHDLDVDSALGYVLRTGFDLMLTEHLGLFFSAQYIGLATSAKGKIDGAAFGAPGIAIPASAKIELDPWVYHGGLTYRF